MTTGPDVVKDQNHQINSLMMASKMSLNCKCLTEPPSELRCQICFEVARDPLQHEVCGKLFCKECLEEYGRSKPCPSCMKESSHYCEDHERKCMLSLVLPVFNVLHLLGRKIIQDLSIRCGNKQCRWEGTVGILNDHLTTCSFTLPPSAECKECEEVNEHVNNNCNAPIIVYPHPPQ